MNGIVIIGGGTAGISVAARLRRAGRRDVTLVEPAEVHHYQPLWTLVGGGRAPVSASARPMRSVVPRGVRWVRSAAVGVDPFARRVLLRDGGIGYDQLVVCPGIQLDWHRLDGLAQAVGHDGVSSNYAGAYAVEMWRFIREVKAGSAVFAMPSGPIKCGGAPQKIAYLAADHWRERGVLGRIDVHLVLPGTAMFAVPEYAAVLEGVARRYGIHVHLESEVVRVRPSAREVVVRGPDGERSLPYDVAHLVPPQSAPDWVKASPLAGPSGYLDVDPNTLRHLRFPDVFGLGDCAGTPNSKTGAAVRKQAPVLVANLLAVLAGRELPGSYDGYSSCPITTGRRTLLLAEFDYTGRPRPTVPLLGAVRERTDHNLVKRRILPFLYWNLMLRGLA
ncbi:FAD/NAD(P)-binding oxidoreductase [Actinosynnema sp. NPDC047251]|uniref:NAD(P)/FAD-dependent oxidoreductase n=1 Tax=Saccharothrix espanaensis TaxID=103731 RepID=UPI0002EF7026|nr:FAD/NAD(P)-binding oxidoreductase [Saccharothrix espanaensis]